ncbi:MAG: HEPN domain-containing protein [Pseudomonadota bacterium]
MKTSLNHLPKLKQQELEKIATTIQENCTDTQKIILFGSYARGDYKEAKDLKPDRKTGHISDYDILVVTEKKEVALDSMLWKKISDHCRNLKLSADPRIITHDIEALNIKLAEAQYFYSDIKKEGVLLFDSKKFQLADQRDLTAKEEQRIAQDEFNHWFDRATGFYEYFEIGFAKIDIGGKEDNGLIAFFLHQAAESAYKTIHLVFTNYNPNEHFLAALSLELEEFCPQLKNLFPQNTDQEEGRFKLLEYAYIGGRYDPEFCISKEDLEILAKEVKILLDLTQKICAEKIRSFIV